MSPSTAATCVCASRRHAVGGRREPGAAGDDGERDADGRCARARRVVHAGVQHGRRNSRSDRRFDGLVRPDLLRTHVPLRYDVRISLPSTLQVRNRNARLVANADLQLRGTYDRPLVFGRAEVESGEFIFEGKRYLVSRGTIDFNNPTRIQPFIDLEMEARVRVPGETYRVTVRVAGTFDRLSLEFSSDPPLPEVEVLALLFSDVAPGRDVEFRQYSTDVTPQQQLLRERAARALTGAISRKSAAPSSRPSGSIRSS
jgi:hypothetical protein